MAINSLQLPSSQALTPSVDWTPLAQLGQVYKKAQNEQSLSDLGKQLAAGTIDYKQAAGQVADMGDITHSLQFLALAEEQKKQADAKASAANFGTSLSSLYGASPTPAVPSSNPMPVPGKAPIPAPAAAGAPVPSSPRVMGDAEGVASGLYDPPAAPGLRPPVQMADASAPAPAAAAPQRATVPVVDNLPGPQHIPVLLKALADPNLPAGQREIAKTMLTEAYKNSKEPEKIQTLRALQADPSLLDVEKQLRAAGKTDVTIDQKSETAFAKEAGGELGKKFVKLTEEGQNATQDLALVGQIRDLGAVVKTGAPTAVQGWLAERGIKVGDNVGAVEAYSSIIDKLTPQQRVPGSGATSDYEGRMFKNSLPKLINTPEGNEIISNTLAGLAQYKLDRGAIAEQAISGELKPSEALKKMRELPNPYDNFKSFAKNGFRADPNDPATAAPSSTGRQPTTAKEVPMTKIEIDQSLANARAAVQRNPAAREAIIQKLKGAGIDPIGL